jgi:hypothetical protein
LKLAIECTTRQNAQSSVASLPPPVTPPPAAPAPTSPILPSVLHGSANPYADEDNDILNRQLKEANIQAARFIPLSQIKEELAGIMTKIHNGEPYDEARSELLFRSMNYNKEYIAEEMDILRIWKESVVHIAQECLQEQRAFIPVDIFTISRATLVEERGVSLALAKRILDKKCLWLIRMSPLAIATLHEADIMGRYNTQGQNLDFVELVAVYAACPVKFENDGTGRKEAWRLALEDNVRNLMKQKDAKTLSKPKLRNALYKDLVGLFPGDDLWVPETVTGDAFARRGSFQSLTRSREEKDTVNAVISAMHGGNLEEYTEEGNKEDGSVASATEEDKMPKWRKTDEGAASCSSLEEGATVQLKLQLEGLIGKRKSNQPQPQSQQQPQEQGNA